MRSTLLKLYACLIGYRFRDDLHADPIRLPNIPSCKALYYDEVRDKARSSINAAGVFLAITIAVLAAALFNKEIHEKFHASWDSGWCAIAVWCGVVILLHLVVRQERILSNFENRPPCAYPVLIFLLLASVMVFVGGGFLFRNGLEPTLCLAGLSLIVISAFFQTVAIELYDAAAGWRGGRGEQYSDFTSLLLPAIHSCSVIPSLF